MLTEEIEGLNESTMKVTCFNCITILKEFKKNMTKPPLLFITPTLKFYSQICEKKVLFQFFRKK